jgi:hypothetical protein
MTARLMRWVMQSWRRVDFFNTWLAGTLAPRCRWTCCRALLRRAFRAAGRCAAAPRDDYVAAGRAMQRFWLTATQLGLQLQPELTPLIFSRYVRERRASPPGWRHRMARASPPGPVRAGRPPVTVARLAPAPGRRRVPAPAAAGLCWCRHEAGRRRERHVPALQRKKPPEMPAKSFAGDAAVRTLSLLLAQIFRPPGDAEQGDRAWLGAAAWNNSGPSYRAMKLPVRLRRRAVRIPAEGIPEKRLG